MLTKYGIKSMRTNLAAKVAASRLTRKQIAEQKNVTPNTLSRHMKGEINLNIEDAIDYAKILECTPQEIMFVSEPLDIVGHNYIYNDGEIRRTYYGLKTTKQVYIPDYYIEDHAAFTWETHEDYDGVWYDWNGAVQIVRKAPIVKHYVDKQCFQNVSVVKFEIPVEECGNLQEISAGVLYPLPANRYTLHSPKTGTLHENVKLIWATPQIQSINRPSLRGCEFVDKKFDKTKPSDNKIIKINR